MYLPIDAGEHSLHSPSAQNATPPKRGIPWQLQIDSLCDTMEKILQTISIDGVSRNLYFRNSIALRLDHAVLWTISATNMTGRIMHMYTRRPDTIPYSYSITRSEDEIYPV